MREHDYNNQISSLRAPVERAVAGLKSWRILFTDYRRPLRTFLSSFRAAIGLYFFKESFAQSSMGLSNVVHSVTITWHGMNGAPRFVAQSLTGNHA